MNFDPSNSSDRQDCPVNDLALPCIAEDMIARTIVEGSGGPDNAPITDQGLRFVRHLLSSLTAAHYGFLPNFKDMYTIRCLARKYILYSGGAAAAIDSMLRVTCAEYI